MSFCPLCVQPYDDRAAPDRDFDCCDGCHRAVVVPARLRGEKVWRRARFEGFPCVYDDDRAFVLFDERGWWEMPLGEVHQKAGMMSRAAFDASYGELPPLPR